MSRASPRALLALLLTLSAGCGADEDSGADSVDVSAEAPGGDVAPQLEAADAAEDRTVTVRTFENGVPAFPRWAAWRDGAGPWTLLTGLEGVSSFEAASGRYGVAIVCATPARTEVRVTVVSATVTELADVSLHCPNDASSNAHPGAIEAALHGLGSDERALVSVGDAQRVVPAAGSPVTFEVVDGSYDVAFVYQSAPQLLGDRLAKRVAIVRGVAVSSATETIDLDLASEGVAPMASSDDVEVAGATPLEALELTLGVVTGRGTRFHFERGAAGRYVELPGVFTSDTDAYFVDADALDPSGGLRSAVFHFAGQRPPSIALPAAYVGTAPGELGGAAYRRFAFRLAPEADTAAYQASFESTGSGGAVRVWRLFYTPGMVAAEGVIHELPDLSAVEGWDDRWAPHMAETVTWRMARHQSNRSLEVFFRERAGALRGSDLVGYVTTLSAYSGSSAP